MTAACEKSLRSIFPGRRLRRMAVFDRIKIKFLSGRSDPGRSDDFETFLPCAARMVLQRRLRLGAVTDCNSDGIYASRRAKRPAFMIPLQAERCTLSRQGGTRFFEAERASGCVVLVAGRQPGCLVRLTGCHFRSRKTPQCPLFA